MKSSSSFSASSSSSKNETRSRTRTRTTRRRNHVARLVGFCSILLAAFGATAQTTNALSDAEIQGRQLVEKLLEQQPTENFTNSGVLQIRQAGGITTSLPLRFELIVTETNWRTIYYADFYDGNQTNGWFKDRYQAIAINHLTGGTNTYQKSESYTWGEKQHGMVTIDGATPFGLLDISANEITSPFAESDFWICDLGLEFLHWPGQKILRGDTARGRLCKVLESTNPNPSTNGYSRVLSWIDNETLGIVEAEAFAERDVAITLFAGQESGDREDLFGVEGVFLQRHGTVLS